MKNKITLLLICLTNFLVFSQSQKRFAINWNGTKTLSVAGFSTQLPSFSDENFSYDSSSGIKFVSQWPISGNVNQHSVEISQINYAPISLSELKDLPLASIPNEVSIKLTTAASREKKNALLVLTPIINRGGFYEKVTSFEISYSEDTNYYRDSNSITNSVLANGEWYRFYVDTTGVFKLSKNFLERLGMNLNGINPREIKIHGNGGKMIPFLNSISYPIDPEENAIIIVGEEDGVFNDNDYILFFAQGPNGWDAEKKTNINCYNDKTYYYITVSSGNGKRIESMGQPSSNPDMVVDSFQEYQYHESDEYNLVQAGRRWFGDRFGVETSRSFEFEFPDLVQNEPIQIRINLGSTSETATSMLVKVNGNQLTNIGLSAISGETVLATESNFSGNFVSNTSSVDVTLEFDNGGNPSSLAYIDYISLEATRDLTFSGKQYVFRNKLTSQQSGVAQYNLGNASQVQQVWDVTDIYNVKSVDNPDALSTLSFNAPMGSLRQFVIVSPSDFYTPSIDGMTQIDNQNIKGNIFNNAQGVFQDIDYLIISPSNLSTQAERLAQINREIYGLNVKVVTLQPIYNEFGIGSQDVGAIRNFVKYVYDNASSPENRIKYLCLFGDTSFDYKDRLQNNTNIVPSWHAYQSLNLTHSFVSDDFYGMMNESEGNMDDSQFSNVLDIAIGRMIVDDIQQAKEMVDKVELYHKNSSMGNWRNNYVLISDDVDSASEATLQLTTDQIGDLVTANKPFINVTKIHSDAYQQESASGGDRYPDVNEAIVSSIEKGALVVNYFGHGGEDGLAHERIFQKPAIQDLNNLCKFNCFITITCEFTRFDNPLRPTAGEFTFWNAQGGSIGLITTTRQIYLNAGVDYNNLLEEYLFSYNPNDDYQDYEYPSVAEALRLTKVNLNASQALNQRPLVFFIGDPALKLAFGAPDVELTHINNVPLGQGTDNLSALSHVKLSGRIVDFQGNLMSNYSGTLSAVIYDKNIQRQTLDNDNNGIVMDFETLGSAIFRGQASISNGLFEFEFVVPKDIAIPLGTGKVSFYATNEELTQDNSGANVGEVVIGGINNNAPEDNQGPIIQLYMNDENFVSGGITNEAPILLAKLQDENGINTASGIGHDITAILDGDETNPYVVNDYYQAEVDDYQNGIVSYPLRDLEPGLHTLTFKAWDVYNNSSIAEIQFMVFDEDKKLVIENVLNYPNPFVNYTEFWFNHNSSAPLDVSVQIFTVSGKLVRTINAQTNAGDCCNQEASSLSRDIIWDGRDDFGDKIGKGVYVYKLTVYSSILNKKVEKIEKLVIL